MRLVRRSAKLQIERRREQGRPVNAFDVSRSAGLIGNIAGLLVLCGWSVLPGSVIRHLWVVSQVHPYAALGFILVGFSVRLARFDGATPWVHPACKIFRMSAGFLGLLSLANIWLRLSLDIDKFIVREPTPDMPGSMPPAAALCLYGLGCALVLLSAKRRLLCQILGLAVTTITMAALVANCYAFLAPQVLPAYLTMPAMTALILLILSLGVVNSNANRSLVTVMTSDSLGGAMARRLLPASVLIPIVLGFVRLKGQEVGWFGPALGLALHVVATMLLLALFIWWNAAALDRIARENGHIEQAVQDAQTTLLEILGHVDNAAFAHDLQGNLTFLNTAAERLFGIPSAEALRKNIYSVITPQSAATAREILSSELIGGERRPELLVLRTSAGDQECAVLTIMMWDCNCNPRGFVSLVSPYFTATASKSPSFERFPDPVGFRPRSESPVWV